MGRPARRAMLLALVAAALALVLAACGGGGGGTDMTQGLTPRQLLDRSAATARKLDTFRISLAAKGTADIARARGVPSAAAGLLNGPIDASGEGPVDPPDKASLDVSLKLSGLPVQANITRVGDGVYLGVLGQDFKVGVPAATVRALDLGDLYPTLAGWIADPKEAGREDVDGTSTVKVTGSVDPAAAARDLTSTGLVSLTPAEARRALTRSAVEVWIGTDDLRPRRVHLTLAGDAAGVARGAGAIDLDVTADWSAFDEPVDIRAPANAQTLDAGSLGSLIGG